MDLNTKKKLINTGSVASALGLCFYFASQAVSLPRYPVIVVTLTAALISAATLLAMIAARQDEGKEGVSGNRIAGQGALMILLALAAAVALKSLAPL